MRIAFLLGSFPAPSETFVLNQITALIDRGHEVDIYAREHDANATFHPDVERCKLPDRVFYCGMSNNVARRLLKGIKLAARGLVHSPRAVLKAMNIPRYGREAGSLKLLHWTALFRQCGKRYDVVHAHFGPNGLLAVALREIGAILPTTKIVTTFYGYDVHFYPRQHGLDVYHPLFRQSDLILTLSEIMKEDLAALGCEKQKMTVHHIGVDVRQFGFSPPQPPSDGVLRLVSIARFVEKKGLEYSVKAIAKAAASGQKLVYDIIGDGELRHRLQALIDELNLAGTVNLLGWKAPAEVRQVLSRAHVLLAPSVTASYGDQEGTPVVLMEAMAMGLPVISTTHAGIPEMVRDAVCGYLVPEREPDALAEAILKLGRESSRWRDMGQAGREIVEAQFDVEKLSDRVVELYQQLVEDSIRC